MNFELSYVILWDESHGGWTNHTHYNDVIMSAMASQITSIAIVYSTFYSGAEQRKHQSSASLAFVRGIHRSPVNFPQKWPVTRKCFHLMTSSCPQIEAPTVGCDNIYWHPSWCTQWSCYATVIRAIYIGMGGACKRQGPFIPISQYPVVDECLKHRCVSWKYTT